MLELLLDRSASGLRSGLESQLRDAVRSGRLAVRTKLPSTRWLAADLGVSRSTVVAAYEQLVAEGYLTASHGSGTRVADVRTTVIDDDEPDLFGTRPEHDFRPGEPDASAFPRRGWLTSVRTALTDAPDSAFAYPDPRGVHELRSEIAAYLARTRTVDVRPSAVRITGGFSAGLGFLADALCRRGVERVAVEDPCFPFHQSILRMAGLTTVPIRVDENGIDVDRLRSADVDAVLVTPAHQFPTSITMGPDRRSTLVAWARDREAWIIEDDYDGEFRYDRRPIGALQGLSPDRVIYAGTASKALTPALRIGWLVVPADFRPDLERVMNLRVGVSAIDQFALADFVRRGSLDRHVRLMRGIYRSRSEQLRSVLADTAPWLELSPGEAGLHLMARLRSTSLDEATVLAAADAASVGLFGLNTHHRSNAVGPGFAIGFSRPAEHHFPAALDRLGDVLSGL